jgi:hypothetical protein
MEEDDEDDDIFWIDVSSFSKEMNEADTYMVNDHDLSNN